MFADIYCASRSLYGLARDGQAPHFITKTLKNGNPIVAVAISSVFVTLGYLNVTKSTTTVFNYFVNLVTVFAVLNWMAILVSYISFRKALKAQNIPISELPYVGHFQPYGAYYSLFISVLIIIFNGKPVFLLQFPVQYSNVVRWFRI